MPPFGPPLRRGIAVLYRLRPFAYIPGEPRLVSQLLYFSYRDNNKLINATNTSKSIAWSVDQGW